MKTTTFSTAVAEPPTFSPTKHGWSIASWVFFELAALASAAFACFWLGVHSTSDDPLATLSVDLARVSGMYVTYVAAWLCALAGIITGLVALRRPVGRAGPAWTVLARAALALNGVLWLVATALFWTW